jgi:hypothetical protein
MAMEKAAFSRNTSWNGIVFEINFLSEMEIQSCTIHG